MVKPTLLVLAAGMGSRYGSLKQMDGVGPNNEAIIDYSVYDAIRAGFGKVVFVIRHSFEKEFREVFSAERFGGRIAVEFVFQELDYLPEGAAVPEGRVKPWGTNHAVMMAADAIREPFAVINADDFYGAEAYKTIGDYLSHKIQAPKVKTDTKAFDQAEKEVKEKIAKLLSIGGKQSVDDIHKKLGHIMWENVGMARTKESLEKAITEIQALRKEFWKDVKVVGKENDFNVELEKALRLADFLELGELMARDALNREESCGGHFRTEHQTEEGEAKRDDEHFVYAAVWEYKGEDAAPELTKEPLNFEFVHPAQRNYKD